MIVRWRDVKESNISASQSADGLLDVMVRRRQGSSTSLNRITTALPLPWKLVGKLTYSSVLNFIRLVCRTSLFL